MVQPHLDTDARVDQTDQSRRNPDEIARSAIRGTGEARHIGHQSSADDEGGLGADDTEGVHGVDDLEHGLWVGAGRKRGGRGRCVLCVGEGGGGGQRSASRTARCEPIG